MGCKGSTNQRSSGECATSQNQKQKRKTRKKKLSNETNPTHKKKHGQKNNLPPIGSLRRPHLTHLTAVGNCRLPAPSPLQTGTSQGSNGSQPMAGPGFAISDQKGKALGRPTKAAAGRQAAPRARVGKEMPCFALPCLSCPCPATRQKHGRPSIHPAHPAHP